MNYLRKWRKERDLTQAEFAEVIREPRGTYQAYESGRSSIPPDVQGKIRNEGFSGAFPEVGETEVSPDDLQALGRDLDRKIDYAHEDLKKDIRAVAATLAALLAKLEAREGNQKA